jgi:cytochrome P450
MRESQRPPGPSGSQARDVIVELRRDAASAHVRLARRYGDLVRLRLGLSEQYLVTGPRYAGEVLVARESAFARGAAYEHVQHLIGREGLTTIEGERHRRERALVWPYFSGARLRAYAPAITACARDLVSAWGHEQRLDVLGQMYSLTAAILGATLLGVSIDDTAVRRIREGLNAGMDMFDLSSSPAAVRRTARFREAQTAFRSVADDVISARRRRGDGHDDVLGLLLSTGDRERSESWVRDHVRTFIQAGSEATAPALTWTLDLLARHPEIQATLHAEAGRVIGDGMPRIEDLRRLRVLRKAIVESMRVRPAAWSIQRRAARDVRLGPYLIPAGSPVVVSPYALHHDPRWFPDPDEYRPDRWERGTDLPAFSFLPFGAGRRRCLGAGLASLTLVLVLATIVRDWEVGAPSPHPLAHRPRFNLQPSGEVPLTFARRR